MNRRHPSVAQRPTNGVDGGHRHAAVLLRAGSDPLSRVSTLLWLASTLLCIPGCAMLAMSWRRVAPPGMRRTERLTVA